MIPNFTATALTRTLAQAIAVLPVGNAFLNLITSTYTQVKTGLGIFSGLTVNTVGTTSVIALFDGISSVVTMTIAVPGVVTWTAHPFVAGGAVRFTNVGGALPTGLTSGTTVYVSSASLTADTFRVSDTAAHAIAGTNTITTSGSQSGVHTGWDVTRPIGTFTTVAQGSLNNGAQFNSGLIAVTSGGAAADLTMLYL